MAELRRPPAYPEKDPHEPWWTKSRAAEHAGVSKRTIERHIENGSLRAVGPPGRVRTTRTWVDVWIAWNEVGAGAAIVVAFVVALLSWALACLCGDQSACHLLHQLGLHAPRAG